MKWALGSSLACAAAVVACVDGSGGSRGHEPDAGATPGRAAAPSPGGSRLAAQYFVGADGSRAYAGMFDTQTKQDCAFVTAADGKYHCLPSGPAVISSTAYYSDPACSHPVLNLAKACTAPPYVSTFEARCGGATVAHVFPTSVAFVPGPLVYLSAGVGMPCAPVQTSATQGAWINTGPEVLPSAFVQGTLEAE